MKQILSANFEGVYAGAKDYDIEGLYVLTKKPVDITGVEAYILGQHYDFKQKKHLTIIKIIGKFEGNLELFWKGKYSQLYSNLSHIPKTIGNKVNYTYHVLANTSIGKSLHKEKLIKYKYVSLVDWDKSERNRVKKEQATETNVKPPVTWEEYQPEEADFPPSKEQEVLNYTSPF
jgi:hypothetical protein